MILLPGRVLAVILRRGHPDVYAEADADDVRSRIYGAAGK